MGLANVRLQILFLLILLSGCFGQITGSDDPSHLDIQYTLKSFKATIGGDLQDEKLAPRIDAYSGQTYFWIRTDYRVNNASFFLESFQGAGLIVKDNNYSLRLELWDGAWVRPGIYYVIGSWSFEGGPVYYSFSNSGRPSHWGALLEFRKEF